MPRCESPIRGTDQPATGTDAGFQRHWRAREDPCEPCGKAHSRHSTQVQQKNPDAHRQANQRWRTANPGYFGRRQKARLIADIDFRMSRILRKRLWGAVAGGTREQSAMALVGCSIDELRAHLESQFAHGMSWDNYGQGGWEIDHVIPVAAFDMTDPEQQRRCFHYSNLQPLWAEDNRRKGTTVRAALEARELR